MLKKIIALFLVACSLSAWASDPQDRFYVIRDFSKGLNSQISDKLTPDNQAVDLLNVRVNKKYGSLCKREAMTYTWDAGSASVNSLHRYYKTDGTIKTLIATSTYLDVGDTSGTGTTHIGQGFTDGKRFDFVTFKDIAIGSNGYEQPIKYDGKTLTTANTDAARTASDLVTELGAPFAELNTGSNLTASKWYQYKVMYLVNGVTYYSTARSNPILTGSTVRDIYLTNIPIGPVGTTARYIYRTVGDASRTAVLADTSYYLAATISDNTTTILADTVTDAALVGYTAWSTSGKYNATPPKGQYLNIHKERMFVAGNTTYPSELYFSDDGNPDFFDPDAFIQVRPDDGDAITFIKTFLGILTVGKTNSIQKFYTEGSIANDWYLSDPFSFIGCPAPYSVVVSPIGILYLGKDGIYQFNGQFSRLISDAVTNNIRDISFGNIYNCAGIFVNNEYNLAYTSKASGEAANNRVLVYDFTRDAYVLDKKPINCWCIFGSSTDVGTLYSGSSASDGYVQFNSFEQPAINGVFKSDLDLGTFTDTASFGTEVSPTLELSWPCTVDTWLTDLQTRNASINTINDIGTYLPNAIIDRPDTDGAWTSPVYYINASALDRLYWNEHLNGVGDITWQVRLGATSAACSSASWNTAVTNPNGSDLSAIAGNVYIQLRANLTTSVINSSPELYKTNGYVFRLLYTSSASKEPSFQSIWKTGWKDFGAPGYKKYIRRIRVFYKGTSGTLNFNIKGDTGDIDKTFSIDLSIDPAASSQDQYSGKDDTKIYTFDPPMNSSTEPSLISEAFQFELNENGITPWEIQNIEIQYQIEEIY